MDIYYIYHEEIPEFIFEATKAPALKRLADVGMNCGCEYTSFEPFIDIEPYSRLEHSIGVGLIAYHFTGSVKQALAGLFHDISTPCFAHVIDFLNGDHQNQQSTEEATREFIENDEVIQQLLKKYGLETADVCDYHMYPICDNDTPRLSSDRLEYTLGNIVNYGFANEEDIEKIYDDLIVTKNEEGKDELAFQDVSAAKKFESLMIKCASIYECDADRCMMEYLALLLKEAMCDGIINKNDLYSTEDFVISKLKENKVYEKKWNEFTQYNKILISTTKKDGYIKVMAKKRYIDPIVADKGRLSSIDADVKDMLEGFKRKGFDYYIKAI